MHVPFIPEQVVSRPAPAPYMAQADIARGIEAALRAIVNHKEDLAVTGGREH